MTRSVLSRYVASAVGEMRMASRRAPAILRAAAVVAAWSALAILYGAIVGMAAVVLPPTGAFGLVAVSGLVLLLVMPDLPTVPITATRKALYVMLVINLCVPSYYTVQVAGLPWISARRLATFLLIVMFLPAAASSSTIRKIISERIRPSKWLVICAVGFLISISSSIISSVSRLETISAMVDAVLSWYVPFFALLYVIEGYEQILTLLRVMCACSIIVSFAGVIEFVTRHRYLLDVFPGSMLGALMESNPTFALLVNFNPMRGGFYRASSIFTVSLSFAEFLILIIPVAIFFVVDSKRTSDRILGVAVIVMGIAGIFTSGARGGWVSLIASTAVYVAFAAVRRFHIERNSLAPAFVGVVGGIFFAVVIWLVLFWQRAHNLVLGDNGVDVNSTQARFDQWALGIPFILSIPDRARVPARSHDHRLGGKSRSLHRQWIFVASGRNWNSRIYFLQRVDVFGDGIWPAPISNRHVSARSTVRDPGLQRGRIQRLPFGPIAA